MTRPFSIPNRHHSPQHPSPQTVPCRARHGPRSSQPLSACKKRLQARTDCPHCHCPASVTLAARKAAATARTNVVRRSGSTQVCDHTRGEHPCGTCMQSLVNPGLPLQISHSKLTMCCNNSQHSENTNTLPEREPLP